MHEQSANSHTLEQGQARGAEDPVQAQGSLAIRARLQMENRARELALFDLGIDSKLGACDLLKLRVRDVCYGDRVASRATVLQQKTQRPVQFEITEQLGKVSRAGFWQAG